MLVSTIPFHTNSIQEKLTFPTAFQKLITRIKEAIRIVLEYILEHQQTIAAIAALVSPISLLLGHPILAGLTAGYAIARLNIPNFLKLLPPPPYIPIRERLVKEQETIKKVFQSIVETKWGNRWLKTKNLPFEQAFESMRKNLDGGTCFGQTRSLIKLMTTHSNQSSMELLNGMKFEEVLRYQMTCHIRYSLEMWKYDDKFPGKLPKNRDKLNQAVLKTKEEELFIPHAKLQTAVPLSYFSSNEKAFSEEIKNQFDRLEKENPGKIIAGAMHLHTHEFFVQSNAGRLRLYDIYHDGLLEFSDKAALISGLWRQVQKYSAEQLKHLRFDLFAVTPA